MVLRSRIQINGLSRTKHVTLSSSSRLKNEFCCLLLERLDLLIFRQIIKILPFDLCYHPGVLV